MRREGRGLRGAGGRNGAVPLGRATGVEILQASVWARVVLAGASDCGGSPKRRPGGSRRPRPSLHHLVHLSTGARKGGARCGGRDGQVLEPGQDLVHLVVGADAAGGPELGGAAAEVALGEADHALEIAGRLVGGVGGEEPGELGARPGGGGGGGGEGGEARAARARREPER